MIEIKINGISAVVDHLQWVCPEMPQLEKLLNARIDPLGPSGADPYPDLTVAREVVEKFGGEITQQDPPQEVEEGRVY